MCDRIFGKGDGGDQHFSFLRGCCEALPPDFPAGLFAGEKEEDGAIEGGAHGVRIQRVALAGISTGSRNSSNNLI